MAALPFRCCYRSLTLPTLSCGAAWDTWPPASIPNKSSRPCAGLPVPRERSDQARLTALMILDRFLHQPVDEALLAGLQDPDTVAAQSLRELVHEMARNQFVVIEYLNQLAEQPPDVARTVIDAIPDQPASPHLITLLRMFAQGEDKALAQAALEQLSRTRSPEAVRALLSLGATLPPAQAAIAARSVRKLRMSGVSDRPEQLGHQPGGWRALLSPVDGAGAQVVWFIGARSSEGGEDGDNAPCMACCSAYSAGIRGGLSPALVRLTCLLKSCRRCRRWAGHI